MPAARKPNDGERVPRCAATTANGSRCSKRALPGASRCKHHSFKVPGRPTKLTAVLQEQILDAVLAGNYIETAAQVAGINKTTLYRWLRRAEDLEAVALEQARGDEPEELDVYAHTDPAEWVYLDFRHALKSAEAFAEVGLLERVRGAGEGWQAFMTVLERRHPERWGRRQALDHHVRGELDSRSKVELIIPAERDRALAVAELLERAGALDADELAADVDDAGPDS